MPMPGQPAWPGPGQYPLPLETWAFAILVSVLALLVLMYLLLRFRHPQGRRWVEGYLEAAGVDLAFLLAGVLLVVWLHLKEPLGNRTAYALYLTILGGYWLTFAIPIVTVGSSVHSRTRGGVPWRIPSVLVAVAIFFAIFSYYYYYGIPAP
ncbi:MAG: hypothetical protein WAN40_09900 [Thermoplasmata archaeon]